MGALPRYPSLYQINTRVWLTELARARGRRTTLDDIPDAELDRVAGMGFDWVWLLSVWRTGPAGQRVSRTQPEWRREFEETLPDLREEDIAGSGFAITGYMVHPDGGSPSTLPDARGYTHGIVSGMARLKPKKRARLPDRAFAYIDSRGQRRLPIHDKAHVRNALARLTRSISRATPPVSRRGAAAERGEEVPHRPRGFHHPATAVRAKIRHRPDPGDGHGGGGAAHRVRDPRILLEV